MNVVVPLPSFVKPTVPEPLVIVPAYVEAVPDVVVSVTDPAEPDVIVPVPLSVPTDTL